MNGRRLPDGSMPYDLTPGDYCKRGTVWWVRVPNSEAGLGYAAPLDERWSVVEHDDGTITVSPSIFNSPPDGWHGYLERGVWRSV